MSREIGSDFNSITEGKTLWSISDNREYAVTFSFSGRSAIQCAIKDAEKRNVNGKRVLLPDYCCSSMIEPFQKAGYQPEFYEVSLQSEDVVLPDLSSYAIVLLCHYFGFRATYPWKIIQKFRDAGGIVVEDITHSLLSENPLSGESDYYIASVRKWDGFVCGGIVITNNGNLNGRIQKQPSNEFTGMRMQAMQLKSEYMTDGRPEKKEEFRKLFEQCEHWLDVNYEDIGMDELSREKFLRWDVEKVRKLRRANAGYLYEKLSGIPGIRFAFPVERMEVPLFVPVILERTKRDALRRMLIQNQVYCPIHWPRPEECKNVLYDQELSLICDQRYGKEDMERIVAVVKEFASQCL